MSRALAVILLALIAAAVPAGASASAAPGYGYGDPRSIQLRHPGDVVALPDGGFLLTQAGVRVLRYTPQGTLEKVAGGGSQVPGPEPIDAADTKLAGAYNIDVLPDGGFVVGTATDVVAFEDGTARVIFSAPTESSFPNTIHDLATEADGSVLVTVGEPHARMIVRVPRAGEPERIAGTGECGPEPDGSAAIDTPFCGLGSIATLPDGSVVFTEPGESAIRMISPDGVLSTVAGGRTGFAGDGGPAVDAALSRYPGEIDATPAGDVLFVDGRRIRRFTPGGTITTVAGTGGTGFGGEGTPALDSGFGNYPGVSAAADGGFLVEDYDVNHHLGDVFRIRGVSPEGMIRTLLGMPALEDCKAAPYNGIQGGPDGEKIVGGRLRDLIRGEGGENVLRGRGASDCLVGGKARDGISAGSGADVAAGSEGDDAIRGGAGGDLLLGDQDDDAISGGGGRDRLYGGSGDDRMRGGPGDDFLLGYLGIDRLSGGRGDDYLDVQTIGSGSNRGPGDVVTCGPGEDTVVANDRDRISGDCEHFRGPISGNPPD
jgi:Ca2+-binding RTX toxin-like protein